MKVAVMTISRRVIIFLAQVCGTRLTPGFSRAAQ
jgi:hypothetical protein